MRKFLQNSDILGLENPGAILQGVDKQGRPFLDILIECELKQVSNFQEYFKIKVCLLTFWVGSFEI